MAAMSRIFMGTLRDRGRSVSAWNPIRQCGVPPRAWPPAPVRSHDVDGYCLLIFPWPSSRIASSGVAQLVVASAESTYPGSSWATNARQHPTAIELGLENRRNCESLSRVRLAEVNLHAADNGSLQRQWIALARARQHRSFHCREQPSRDRGLRQPGARAGETVPWRWGRRSAVVHALLYLQAQFRVMIDGHGLLPVHPKQTTIVNDLATGRFRRRTKKSLTRVHGVAAQRRCR